MADKLRLGGMALRNGVLVHGPTGWGCAVRIRDGSLKVAAEKKRIVASRIKNPLLRGPARLAEALAVLPAVKRRLPEAKLPFEQPWILAAMVLMKMIGGAWVAIRLHDRRLLEDRALVAGAVCWLAAVLAIFGVLVWFADSPAIPRYFLGAIAILNVPLARVSAAPLALEWSRHR